MKNGILFLLLLTSISISAQSYQLFHASRDYTFGYIALSGETYLDDILHIDSVATFGGDSIFYPYRIFKKGGAMAGACEFSGNSLSWAGSQIIKTASGEWLIGIDSLDTLKILSQNAPGSAWRALQLPAGDYFEARVDSIFEGSFLGITDSIKSIRFYYMDAGGAQQAHPVNGMEIRISKNFGLVKAFRFRDFPNIVHSLDIYGMANPDSGRVFPAFTAIWDWDIGDVFQYVETDIFAPIMGGGYADSLAYEYAVISAIKTTDSLIYQCKRSWVRDLENAGSPAIRTWGRDTVQLEFYRGEEYYAFWYWPEETEFPFQIYRPEAFGAGVLGEHPIVDAEQRVHFFSPLYNGRSQITLDGVWMYDSTVQCLSRIPYFGFSPENDFAVGLGRVHNDYFEPFNHDYNFDLVYFRKGNETWGTFTDFVPITSVWPQNTETGIRVFPNPASEWVVLEFPPEIQLQSTNIELFDLAGKCLLRQTVQGTDKTRISLGDYAPGMYLLRFNLQNGLHFSQRLILRGH